MPEKPEPPQSDSSAQDAPTTPDEDAAPEALPETPLHDHPTARLRGRRTLPASPVERAKLEAQLAPRSELFDRSTQVAFGMLFILPIFIIIFALLLLFPLIKSQLIEEPSGVDTQSISKGQTPTR